MWWTGCGRNGVWGAMNGDGGHEQEKGVGCVGDVDFCFFLGQSLQNSVKVWTMETTAIVTHGGVAICASCLFANWSV